MNHLWIARLRRTMGRLFVSLRGDPPAVGGDDVAILSVGIEIASPAGGGRIAMTEGKGRLAVTGEKAGVEIVTQ